MSELSKTPNLKEINAYKKKLNWGEIPAIYHLASTSVGNLEGILTHGFDSAYKTLLRKDNWNLSLLGGSKSENGEISVTHKPQIALKHVYNEQHYQLHCFPVVDGEMTNRQLEMNPYCPFIKWYPETMSMLFRVNSIVSFIAFAYQKGDQADMALIKHAYTTVNKLIDNLSESFDIVEIKGLSIAQFYQELVSRKGDMISSGLIEPHIQSTSES